MSDAEDNPAAPGPSEVSIRRAPKIATFLILGGGLGAIVTFILTAIYPVDPSVGFGALFGYFALYGVTAGVLAGAVVAIVLDRTSTRRARTVSAIVEKTDVVGDTGLTETTLLGAGPDDVGPGGAGSDDAGSDGAGSDGAGLDDAGNSVETRPSDGGAPAASR